MTTKEQSTENTPTPKDTLGDCRSAITYIDGDKGILRHRGYSIKQLADAKRR